MISLALIDRPSKRSKRRRRTSGMRVRAVAWILFQLTSIPAGVAAGSAPAVNEIVRRSIEADQRNTEAARNYVYDTRVEKRELDAAGAVKNTESKTWKLVEIDGHRFRKLIALNDKPLSADEERKDQERLNKAVAQRKNETTDQKAKREAATKENREKEKNFNREILDAFNFRLLGDERVGGRDCWMIEGTPRPGYRPKEIRAQMFLHVQGRLWVDKQDYQWAKAEAEVIDTFSVGLVVAKVEKGTRFALEQTRVNDEVWLPRAESVHASARIALIKKIAIDERTTFQNYTKVLAQP